jgi:hypothetical protein
MVESLDSASQRSGVYKDGLFSLVRWARGKVKVTDDVAPVIELSAT